MTKTPRELALEYAHEVRLFWDGESIDHHIVTLKELAFLDGYKAGKSQWVSIENRLPEDEGTVLVFINYSVGDVETRAVATGSYGSRLWTCGNDKYSEGFITHWMPLPKPPEE
jgi:hypothetical protein